MTIRASGTFEVKMAPLDTYCKDGTVVLGRMSVDKQFKGDLDAVSKGEMLGVGKPEKGAAGYVAMEVVSGALHGKKGGFAFQHSGTVSHGAFELSVTVVPGSGTGELTGLSGKLTTNVVEGKHSYEFDYSLDGE